MTNNIRIQHCLKSIWKKLLSFCPPEVNCGSPITRSDDWSHKGGHKQIFRRAPRGRGWDGGRQKGKENQNHFWQNLSKLWCCIILGIQGELDISKISYSSLSVAWFSSDLTVYCDCEELRHPVDLERYTVVAFISQSPADFVLHEVPSGGFQPFLLSQPPTSLDNGQFQIGAALQPPTCLSLPTIPRSLKTK